MAVTIDLHDVVAYHRKQAGLSRDELAQLAGTGKTVIYDLEKGKQTVKWSTVQAILAALNIHLEFQSPLMHVYKETYAQSAGENT